MSPPGTVGFGVIGANSFIANAAVLPAIEAALNARLVATASRGGDVPERWAGTDAGSYEAVLAHPDVEAVYVPLPNGMHCEWTEKAAAAGKHVLVEKPLASDSVTARAMADVGAAAGVLIAEAWMTPFHHRYRQFIDGAGKIGGLEHIESRFTFTIGPEAADNYRWDPDQGGGALLDVGIYCLGPIVDLFGSEPSSINAVEQLTDRGVDASTSAQLTWAEGRSASIHCSFIDEETQTLQVSGVDGSMYISSEAFTGAAADDTYRQTIGERMQDVHVDANDSYQSMIEAFASAVRDEREWPRPVERSIEMLTLIERIKEAARA
jgi:xylose dehydrogenase (NAD/NADP)